jgi:hypothetical protein
MLLNIEGMNPSIVSQRDKIKFLEETIHTSDKFIPIVVACESHLEDGILNPEVSIHEYNIYRSDRIRRKCGGTLIYVHQTIQIDNIEQYSDSVCEAVLLYSKSLNQVIIGLYRPPHGHPNLDIHTSFKNMLNSIEKFISRIKNVDLMMMEDFNLPSIDWTRETVESGKADKKCAEMLLDFMNKHLLTQHVMETTRKKNTLDIIITNHPEEIHSVEVEKVSKKISDHDLVKCNILQKFAKKKPPVNTYEPQHRLDALNFKKAKWQEIQNEISETDWKCMDNKSVEEMCSYLEETITTICEHHTPKHKLENRKRYYIPKERRSMIKLKQNINHKINLQKYVHTNRPHKDRMKDIDQLISRKTDIEEKIKESIRNEEKLKEERMLAQIKSNPKVLYAYAKRKKKSLTNIGPLEDEDGKLKDDPTIMANILQRQYKAVFSNPETDTEIDIETNQDIQSTLDDIDFTEEDILKAINLIPYNSAGGPDKFPASIFKECKDQLSKPLFTIWRKSLDTGKIPHKYLQQCIVPIFKKDNKAKAENYRPVSLTAHIIKIMERVLRVKIIEYIETNNILSNEQYGFRQGRSCMSQLINHYENLISILEENENADALYLDMSKAFDRVDHAILLKKMYAMGIRGRIHQWLAAFLKNRKQYVLVDGYTSDVEEVLSGVPQGTVLGPLMFILYINDITKYIKNCYIKIFADDSKIVKAINKLEDRELLSEDLQAVTEWAVKNKMALNKLKYQLLQYGKDESLKLSYNIDNTEVSKSQIVKDLGIYMSEDMLFDEHITRIKNKAKQVAGWILRLVQSRSADVVMLLYKTYVRPHLEYSCCLWSPTKIKNISDLEGIQRSITAKISEISQHNYYNRLKRLDLMSLQRRRERYDLIQIWKIQNNIIPNDLQLTFYETSRHGWKCRMKPLPKRRRKLATIKENSFSNWAAALFNILPKQVKEAATPENFKSRLDRFIKKIPDEPPINGYVSRNKNSLVDWAAGRWDGKSEVFRDQDSTDDITPAQGEEHHAS